MAATTTGDAEFAVTLGPRPTWVSAAAAPAAAPGEPYRLELRAEDAATYAPAPGGTTPPGLLLSDAGVLEGALADEGVYAFTVRASAAGAGARFADRAFTLRAAAPPRWSTPQALGVAEAGAELGLRLRAAGAASFELAAGALPAGVSLSAAGGLAGAPAAGAYAFTVRAQPPAGAAVERAFTLAVRAPPAWDAADGADAALAALVPGEPLALRLAAAGATEYEVAAGDELPAGLVLARDGELSGAAAAAVCAAVRVRARAGAGGPARDRVLRVTASAAPAWQTPSLLPDAAAGDVLALQLAADGAASFAFAAEAPPGLELSAGGLLTGSPGAGGAAFAVDAADAWGRRQARREFTLAVAPAPPALAGAADLALGVDVASARLVAAGADAYAAEGLPPGVSLSADGRLTGAPTQAGTFAVLATASAGGRASAVASVTLRAAEPPRWTTAAGLPDVTAWAPFALALSAANALSYEAAAPLPAGVTLSPHGRLSGTLPSAAAGASATVVRVRALGALPVCSAEREFTLPVTAGWALARAAVAGLTYDRATDALAWDRGGGPRALEGPAFAAERLRGAYYAGAGGAGVEYRVDGGAPSLVWTSAVPRGAFDAHVWRATRVAAGVSYDAAEDRLRLTSGAATAALAPPGLVAEALRRVAPPGGGDMLLESRGRGLAELAWRSAVPAAAVRAAAEWRLAFAADGVRYEPPRLTVDHASGETLVPPPALVAEALARVCEPGGAVGVARVGDTFALVSAAAGAARSALLPPAGGGAAQLAWPTGAERAEASASPAWRATSLTPGLAYAEGRLSARRDGAEVPLMPPALAAAALARVAAPGAAMAVTRVGAAFRLTAHDPDGGGARVAFMPRDGLVAALCVDAPF